MVSNRSKAFSADCRSPREGADGDASVAVGDASVAVGDASVAVGEVAVAVGEVAAVDALGVLGSRPGWEVCIL
jgi:hypothetical protein